MRHGPPLVQRGVPAHEWRLDPAAHGGVRALADRLPPDAAWFSSPEPKALETARLLTAARVTVVPALREHLRETSDWIDDFDSVVQRAFAQPDVAAYDGWEPLERCRTRVLEATRALLAAHPHGDVVLVGHGTAWTVLVAGLTGSEPDLDRWRALGMPDVWVVEQPLASKG